MSSLNKVQLIGHLGQDPEIKTVGQNKVANLSLATTEKWKDKQGQTQEKTEWHRIVMWGKLAELAERFLMKGSLIYVEGKLQTRSWEDNGVKKYATDIQGQSMQFLAKIKENRSGYREDHDHGPQFNSSEDIPY